MDLTKTSAYGGGTWTPRQYDSKDERIWGQTIPFGLDSEYKTLKVATLHLPQENISNISDAEHFQMLDIPTPYIVQREVEDYANLLHRLGVSIMFVGTESGYFHPNLIFTRDVFAMTPYGVILGRPATSIRAGEESEVGHALINEGIPIIYTMHKTALFEGSDMLWVTPQKVFIGIHRTNEEAFSELAQLLAYQGVEAIPLHINKPGNQHLLGTCNIVNDHCALVRPAKAPDDLIDELNQLEYTIFEVPEDDEVVHKQAMNVVAYKPGRIIMPADCPTMKRLYSTVAFIDDIQTTKISEIRKMAGGLACMTGPVRREM